MHMIENGNVAAALGVKLAGAQVIAAYPITPRSSRSSSRPAR
jgi:pyruvate/2-oxoacid:ferredoxin oxidoreductase alpha subunit